MPELPPAYFRRQDETPDTRFYQSPRLVAHIDDPAIAALGEFLRPLVPDGAAVLDLMSAYLTHLPPDVRARCARVAGLGMNDAEMVANAQLTEHVVHSLNDDPRLPYDDASFDIALCTVSVQYLLRPTEVFTQVQRALRPGAPFVVSFSNRCFPTKAIAAWLGMDDAQHAALVSYYFTQSGGWDDVQAADISPAPERSDPLFVVWARAGQV